jgi:hypothetical protein
MRKSLVSRQDGKWIASWGRRLVTAAEFVDRLRAKLLPSAYEPRSTATRADFAVAVGMGLIATIITYYEISLIDPRVYDSWNIYFQGDGIRVLADMTDRFSAQWRTNVHPIFSILTFPAMHALMALGLQKVAAANVLLLTCAAVSGALFYLTLRGLGLSLMAAVVFDAAFLASATFIHWYSYVETYAFAATTIVGLVYMLTSGRATWLWGWGLASAGVLAVGIANWALALAAGFFRLPLLVFMRVFVGAFIAVAAIACLQRATFPTSSLFFNLLHYRGEYQATQLWLQSQGLTQWSPADNIRSVLLTSAVVPPPAVEDADTPVGVFRLVNNQYSSFLQSSSAGFVALACWLFLLGAGIWGAWRDKARRAVAIPIVAYMVFQVVLYSVYGEITFLYAGNFFPALMLLATFGWFTPLRKLVMGAGLAFVVFAGINNQTEFQRAAKMSTEIAAHLAATGDALCIPTCALGRRGH